MSRSAAVLLLLALLPLRAAAVETLRISMGEAADEVRVSGRALVQGPDSEEGPFVLAPHAALTVRRRGDQLEVNGVSLPDTSLRFSSGLARRDSDVSGHEAVRANGFEVRGDVVVRLHKNGLQLINVIPLEDYLAAVLGGEMPVSFPLEALKAQAVAARTYALQRKLASYSEPFHLGSSVLHQVYKGLNREDARTRAAVLATRGEVLTHELAPIEA